MRSFLLSLLLLATVFLPFKFAIANCNLGLGRVVPDVKTLVKADLFPGAAVFYLDPMDEMLKPAIITAGSDTMTDPATLQTSRSPFFHCRIIRVQGDLIGTMREPVRGIDNQNRFFAFPEGGELKVDLSATHFATQGARLRGTSSNYKVFQYQGRDVLLVKSRLSTPGLGGPDEYFVTLRFIESDGSLGRALEVRVKEDELKLRRGARFWVYHAKK